MKQTAAKMEISNKSRVARARLLEALRRELLGPSSPEEIISEFPTSRYIVGRLAPARESDEDQDSVIDPGENDSLGVGEDDDEAGQEETSPPLVIAFNPSSFGLSFLVDDSVEALRAVVSWGDYRREPGEVGQGLWRRYQRECCVDGVSVTKSGGLPSVALSGSAKNPQGVTVTGTDDPEIALEGVVHQFSGYRAISLFVVNRRTKGSAGDRDKDERWIFQPQLSVTSHDSQPAFVARRLHQDDASRDDDGDAATNALLYLDAREFATGHGVAAGWDVAPGERPRATRIFTEFMPHHEVPLLIAPSQETGGATLDMKTLGEATGPSSLVWMLEPMIQSYREWIDRVDKASLTPDVQADAAMRDAAKVNIRHCEECLNRMTAGLELLESDANVFAAFQFANRAMHNQRVHSIWASSNRRAGKVTGAPSAFDIPKHRTWRPFQMGFILANLRGLADESSEDRRLVDLLWFPTGGGKTEAYLGLAAFTLALRRLRGDRFGMEAGAGVSIIMRYTLRLLTVQQFQRAAALICACELLRQNDQGSWGNEPFQIGVWVGRNTTPNTYADSAKALDDIKEGKKPRTGSPIQLVSCPRCGTNLVNDKGVPRDNTYVVDPTRQRTLVWCCNIGCEFSAARSASRGLPVVVVDEEIYRTCPSLLVATVDKFARVPFKGETRTLFGLRDRYSPTYGHVSEADGDTIGGRRLRDARAAKRLLPPELIIQDELHLISGPLGTMVGLYETVLDFALAIPTDTRRGIPAKIVASTATIRRAAQQVYQLYGGRRLVVFPPSGISAADSFFARAMEIDPADDTTAGRLYVGVNAPGSSTKTLLVRVYSVLLAAAQSEIDADPTASDPYGTLVGYFGSMRALGGAKRLVENDVRLVRLKYLAQQRGFPRRHITEPDELTGRLDSWKIPGLLKKLDNPFPRGQSDWPVDVLLATNMISVGVDIDRLGLMVVTGQPKATAEYIQATSRVGRKHPGLVVTMYNWVGARDLSHYERFQSYHSALYRYVEAISVTPFSSRALDRGLRGVFTAINRLFGPNMAGDEDAEHFDSEDSVVSAIVDSISQRATLLVGKANATLVRDRLLSYRDEWSRLADDMLRYCWLDDSRRPPNNTRVLLRTAGTANEGEWPAPGSLREVEPTAAFYLDEGETLA